MKKKGTNLIEMKNAYNNSKSTLPKMFLLKYFFLSTNIILLTSYFILMSWNLYMSFTFDFDINSMKDGNIYKKIYYDIKSTTVMQELYTVDNNTIFMESTRNYNQTTNKLIAEELCKYHFDGSNVYNLFDDFSSLSNTCSNLDEFGVKYEFKYERYCDSVINLSNTVRLYSYNMKFFCYKSYPRKRYVLKYTPIVQSCAENEIQCGVSGKNFKICMELTENIKKCPIVDIIPVYYKLTNFNITLTPKERFMTNTIQYTPANFINTIKIEDEEKGQFADTLIFQHISNAMFYNLTTQNKRQFNYQIKLNNKDKKDMEVFYVFNDKNITYKREDDIWELYLKRFTDESSTKLSANLLIETINFSRYNITENLDLYLKKRKMLNNEVNFNIVRGDKYISNFVNDLSSPFNPLSRIRFSITSNFRERIFLEFMSQFPNDFLDKYTLVNFDEDSEAYLDRKYIFYPNSTCIETVFKPFNLDQNILQSTTYIIMDFLNIISSLNQTWVICQIVISLIFIFFYEIKILVKKINENFVIEDMKNETYTKISLKFLQYFCLITRFMIMFQGKRTLDDKLNFLNQINVNNCYNGMTGLLYKVFEQSPKLIAISNTINVIFQFMIVEFSIEVLIILHLNLERLIVSK